MSFNVALSGIASAQTDLNTTANNIANVNTVGFKESRAEFNSIYAHSNNKDKTGDGVETTTVAQQFHQGSLKFTENALDLAISGQGFFTTTSNPVDRDFAFTRAGTFKLDSENYIVNNEGHYLQAFPVNLDGSSSSISLSTTSPIQIPETAGVPIPTNRVDIALNLPSGSATHNPANFDPNDPKTYNHSTSVAIYDSLGESHVTSTFYLKPDDASYTGNNHWVTFVTVDGKPVSVWDKLAGAPVAGSYTKDVNSDGEADTIANLNQAVTDATVISDAATAVAAASLATSLASNATANADAATAAAAVVDDAANPTAASAALVLSTAVTATASKQKATIDAVIASVDEEKKEVAIKARTEALELVVTATTVGAQGSAQYKDAKGNTITGAVLSFDALGVFKGSSPETLTLQALGLDDPSSIAKGGDGADVVSAGADGTQRLTLNFQKPTQFSAAFEVTNLEQNGLTVGRLTGVDIDNDGLVKATYSNGTSQPLSRIAMVRFRNDQGLSQVGSSWSSSEASGIPIAGEAASGSFGTINSSALEQSNVNLTTELFDLITAQRNFQANSRALEVNNTLQQTILQIR